MENKERSKLILDLIRKEVQNFQLGRQRLRLGQNSGCPGIGLGSSSGSCAANEAVGKLINILEQEKIGATGGEFPEFSALVEKENPVQKALSNSVVLREILSCIWVRHLLEFRQVCKFWKEEINSLLLSPRYENSLCVGFLWSSSGSETGGFRCTLDWENEGDLYYLMKKFLANSNDFPCKKFTFMKGQLNEPVLIKFFSEFGSRVNHLDLKTDIVEMATLHNIIFKWAPNLKSLILEPTPRQSGERRSAEAKDDNNGKTPVPLAEICQLPNLRKITLPKTWSSDPHVTRALGHLIQQILTCAPNLSLIQDPNLSYIPQIKSAGKIPMLKTLSWRFDDEGRLNQNFLGFVAASPQLSSINVEVGFGFRTNFEILPAFQLVLKLSQNTLEKIAGIDKIWDQVDPITQNKLSVPPLPRVKEWAMRVEIPQNFKILPQGQALCQMFPNLKSLHVEVVEVNLTQHPFNAPSYAHDLVEKLKISCGSQLGQNEGFRPEWLEVMGRLYPNVTHLGIVINKRGVSNIPQCLKLIPRVFPQLEQLLVKIGQDLFSIPDNFERTMDEALVGLPPHIWDQLWQRVEPDPEFQKPEVLEQIRIAQTILDLKSLKSLIFEVDFEEWAAKRFCFWSRMAQLYAFQPLARRQGFDVFVRGWKIERVPLTRDDLVGPH